MFLSKLLLEKKEAVTPEMTSPQCETHLPTSLTRFELKGIYNADEFGLFYQALPTNGTLGKEICWR